MKSQEFVLLGQQAMLCCPTEKFNTILMGSSLKQSLRSKHISEKERIRLKQIEIYSSGYPKSASGKSKGKGSRPSSRVDTKRSFSYNGKVQKINPSPLAAKRKTNDSPSAFRSSNTSNYDMKAVSVVSRVRSADQICRSQKLNSISRGSSRGRLQTLDTGTGTASGRTLSAQKHSMLHQHSPRPVTSEMGEVNSYRRQSMSSTRLKPLTPRLRTRSMSVSDSSNNRQKDTNLEKKKLDELEQLAVIQQQKAILRVEEWHKQQTLQRKKETEEAKEKRRLVREKYKQMRLEQEQRRAQIYALNSIMKQIETNCFEAFKEKMQKSRGSHPISELDENENENDTNKHNSDSESEDSDEDSLESETVSFQLACKI